VLAIPLLIHAARLKPAAALGLLMGACCLPAWSQAPNLGGTSDISRLRVPVPIPQLPDFELRVQTPERAPTPRSVEEIDFDLKGIRVLGVSRYSEAELAEFFADVTGRKVRIEELRKKVSQLEDRYRSEGFFLCRVFLPPQQVKNGIFTVQVVEGYISDVYVDGGLATERSIIQRMLAPLLDRKPIDLLALEEALLILNDIPSVRTSGTLRPGAKLGATELVVSVAPQAATTHQVGLNNSASNTLGPWAFSWNASIPRPFGVIGSLNLGLNSGLFPAEKLRVFVAQYSMPLDWSGAVMSLGALSASARPKASLSSLGILGESSSIGLRFRIPVFRSVAQSLFFDFGLSVNRSQTFLSASTESETALTSDRTTVGDLGLSYQHSGFLGGTSQVGLTLQRGLNGLGAYNQGTYGTDLETYPRPTSEGFDSHFAKRSLSLIRLQGLPGPYSLVAAVQVQDSNDPLLAGDKVAFGGPIIGRGYDSGAITGDRGYGGILELRWDRTRPLALPWAAEAKLQAFVAYDFAHTTTLARPLAEVVATKATIASMSLGTRLRTRGGLSIESMVAHADRPVTSSDSRPNPRFLIGITQVF
jgi:hemolysin activation/secretion protein